jgi:hypothetical protein
MRDLAGDRVWRFTPLFACTTDDARSDTPSGCNFFGTKLGVGEQVTMPALAVWTHHCDDIQPITSVGVLIHQDTAVEMLL